MTMDPLREALERAAKLDPEKASAADAIWMIHGS